MARLSGELGYPARVRDMRQRLAALLPDERHCIAVAVDGDRLLGWVHVDLRLSIVSGDRAELVGLVVDATARRRGIGRALVAVAERWVLGRHLPSIIVRSNIAREQSHPFYESLGYLRRKTQHVYEKHLAYDKHRASSESQT